MMKEFPYVKYHDDGAIEIFGNKEGYPRFKGVIPAPDVNHKTEEEREKTHREACEDIVLQGYLITKKRRIRNTAFDRRDQKTTLSIQYRPCMNEVECVSVKDEILTILKSRLEKEQ